MSQLPILMYHNVCRSENESNDLTISILKLEKQFFIDILFEFEDIIIFDESKMRFFNSIIESLIKIL